jgi:hypothetical protein
LINNQKNQQIEFGNKNEVQVNIENIIVLENNQRDLLSLILNDGKNSWGPIIFLYLEGDELRKSNMVCKIFYNIINVETFLESRAEIEFQKTLENYFQKFNPQMEKIGPYEVKINIQNDQNDFVLDKFESKKFYFPFSLTFFESNDNKHFQAIFIPSKNVQENYLAPQTHPECQIRFNSNLWIFGIPNTRRNVTYKINFKNMNQVLENYSKNKNCLLRKFALKMIWNSFVSLTECFLWYNIVFNKKFGIKIVCGIFNCLLSAFNRRFGMTEISFFD